MNRPGIGLLLLLLVAFQQGTLCAQAAGSAQDNYPLLASGKLAEILDHAQNSQLSLILAVLREHPDLLGHKPESDSYLKLLIALNNCNNPQIASAFANEFDYPRVAEFYREKAPQILAQVPTTITLSYHTSVGKYDPNIGGFILPYEADFAEDRVRGVNALSGCSVFSHMAKIVTPMDDAWLRLSSESLKIWKVPISEEAARKYVDSLETPALRPVEVDVRVEILPDQPAVSTDTFDIGCHDNPLCVQIPGEPTTKVRNYLLFFGHIIEATVSDGRPRGGTLATFDPLSPDYRDRSGHLATTAPTNEEVAAIERKAESNYFEKHYQDAYGYSAYACRHGNQDGCAFEGLMLAFGVGTLPDAARAKELITNSCTTGDGKGCNALGLAYRAGVIVASNHVKAFQLFTGSCSATYALGCVNLAESYENGDGVAQDNEKAYSNYDQACILDSKLLLTACKGSDADECKAVGYCYARGSGLEKNLAVAATYLQEACQLGEKAACAKSNELATCVHDPQSITCVAFMSQVVLSGSPTAEQQAAAGIWIDPSTTSMWMLHESDAKMRWEDAADYCKAQRGAGLEDWRLPTGSEIQGIFNCGVFSQSGGCEYHLSGAHDIRHANIWSSKSDSSLAGLTGAYFDPEFGKLYGSSVTDKYYALCVRTYHPGTEVLGRPEQGGSSRVVAPNKATASDGSAGAPAVPQIQDAFSQKLQPEGIWLDDKTNLMWTIKDSENKLNWHQAADYCSALRLGQLSGWRLPQKDEFQGIFDLKADAKVFKQRLKYSDDHYYLRGPFDLLGGWYWTAETIHNLGVNTDQAVAFIPLKGSLQFQNAYQWDKSEQRALCVRSYQPTIDGVD